jgi:1-acyl-sn-glycerol-3-phosphate acyltransferase
MGGSLRFLRNAAVFQWTLLNALHDYRRRGASRMALAQRADWLHRWSGVSLARLKIAVEVEGAHPASGLIVSNHLSYLDILVFGSAMPSVFVSKSEVKNWPVFGMMANMAGTVFVDRKRKSDTRNANDGIRKALQEGERVLMFPEGTSSDGTKVLPFYPSLFEPAVENRTPVTAAHIGYELEDGNVGQDIAYWGDMTFFPHLVKLFSKRGVKAKVRFAKASRKFEDRKVAAMQMRAEVLHLHGAGEDD